MKKFHSGVAFLTLDANQEDKMPTQEQLNVVAKRWDHRIHLEIGTVIDNPRASTMAINVTVHDENYRDTWNLAVMEALMCVYDTALIAVAHHGNFGVPKNFEFSDNYNVPKANGLIAVVIAHVQAEITELRQNGLANIY